MKLRYIDIPKTWNGKDTKDLSIEENQQMIEHYYSLGIRFN